MRFSAILGAAGSGKSTLMRDRARVSGESIRLTASTGIAAVNLGPSVTTINSLCGFYDLASLTIARSTGKLRTRLREVSMQFDTIAIDEVSMLSAPILDALIDAFLDIEATQHFEAPDILVLGDFLQLSPVNAPFAFEGRHWKRFGENTEKLEGSYRQQGDPVFYQALQSARAGHNVECALQLRKAGISYSSTIDENFDGLTISPLNASVNKINRERYASLSGVEASYTSRIWGYQQSDWKAIPGRIDVKVGCKVMILANKRDRETGEMEYVNGDSGVVTETQINGVSVTLDRNGETVFVPFVTRRKMVTDEVLNQYTTNTKEWDEKEHAWCIGRMSYLPLRLAYASTIHKAQGLTLNRVQIDTRSRFAGEPGMMYTALSRVRAAKDLVIVTKSAGEFSRRIKNHPKVVQWV